MNTTFFAQPFEPVGCNVCRDKSQLPFDFTMAFQPIMDLVEERPFAYEALVRGVNGESAATVLGWVDDSNRYRFDQACRVKAIELAARLHLAAEKACVSSSTIHNMPFEVTPDAVFAALLTADAAGRAFLAGQKSSPLPRVPA